MQKVFLVTSRIQRMREGTVFSLFASSHLEGSPSSNGWEYKPSPEKGDTPSHNWVGTPSPDGGHPISYWGYPISKWGTAPIFQYWVFPFADGYLARSVWGIPKQDWIGVPAWAGLGGCTLSRTGWRNPWPGLDGSIPLAETGWGTPGKEQQRST